MTHFRPTTRRYNLYQSKNQFKREIYGTEVNAANQLLEMRDETGERGEVSMRKKGCPHKKKEIRIKIKKRYKRNKRQNIGDI